MRRRTVRSKEGLARQSIREEEATEPPGAAFAVRRTKSKKDPDGLVDRDV